MTTLAHDFPTPAGRPDDGELTWFREASIAPEAVPLLDFAYLELVFEGFARASGTLSLPVQPRLARVGTYVYQATALAVPADQLGEAAARSERALEEAIGGLGEFWETRALPEVQAALAAWDTFDLPGATGADLAAHLDETWTRALRAWELHFLIGLPEMLALSLFEDTVQEVLGGADPFAAQRLLQGIPSMTTDADRALWLAAQAPPAEREARLQEYLAVYGAKSDGLMSPSVPGWRERPDRARDLLALLEGAPDPADRQAELAAERERSLAEARARLAGAPPATRERFERGLEAATVAIRLHEDHHFWIDASVTNAVRSVLVETGRRLAPAVIPSAEDVFHLTPAELREGLLEQVALHDAVRERQDEIRRFAGAEPPPFLGPAPEAPADDPFTRMMARMLGFPVEQHGGAATVQGNPGSAGTVRGRARVVASLDDVDRLEPGDVLVAPMTTPPWTPLFAQVAAVVTDTGGILSHAAVVAREYGIPAVVGTGIATSEIPDGALVEVDGAAGTVRIIP